MSAEGRYFGVPDHRTHIIGLLTEAYARDDLEQREFERRVELAESSRTIEELDALIADFPADALERYGVSAPARATTEGDLEREIAALDAMSAPTHFTLLGDHHMKASPDGPRVFRSVTIVGDAHIDLRDLAGRGGVFLLKVVSLVGDTKITIPAGSRLVTRHFGVLGDVKRRKLGDGFFVRLARGLGLREDDETKRTPQNSNGPTVVVTGFKLIGDLKVYEE